MTPAASAGRWGLAAWLLLSMPAVPAAAQSRPVTAKPKAPAPAAAIFKEESRLRLTGADPEMTTVDGGSLFAAGNAEIVRVDLAGGKIAWRTALDAAAAGRPAVLGPGTAVIDAMGRVQLISSDGTAVSRFEAGAMPAAAASSGGPVFIRTIDGRAFVLDAAGGSPPTALSSDTPSTPFTAGPVIVRGLAVFGDRGGRLTAFGPDGKKRWTYAASGPVMEGLTSVGGDVYFGTADRWFHSLSGVRGRLRWRTRLAGCAAFPASVSGTKLVLATTSSVVYCLKKRTGTVLWWRPIRSRVFDRPLVSEGLVFLSGDFEGIDIFDLAGGEARGRVETPGYAPGGPRLSAVWYSSGRLAALSSGDGLPGTEVVFFRRSAAK